MHAVAALVLAGALAAAGITTAEKVKLGEALVGRGDAKKARPHLESALSAADISDDDKAKASQALGLALIQLRKPQEAVPHLELAAKMRPQNEKAWLYLGIAKDQAGDAAGSIAAYEAGVAAVPKSTTLKHELGMAYLSAGKNAEGANILELAATKNEADPELAADAAYALSLVGKFKPAREFALRACEMSPENPNALYTLGMAELGLGNTKAAHQAFDDAIDSDETHVPALFQLGVLLAAADDHKGAAQRFTTVLKIEPDHARARAALGVSLAAMGNSKEAEDMLRGAVKAEPKLASAWAMLGDLLAKQGKIGEAKKALQTSYKLKANPQVKARLDGLAGAKEGVSVP